MFSTPGDETTAQRVPSNWCSARGVQFPSPEQGTDNRDVVRMKGRSVDRRRSRSRTRRRAVIVATAVAGLSLSLLAPMTAAMSTPVSALPANAPAAPAAPKSVVQEFPTPNEVAAEVAPGETVVVEVARQDPDGLLAVSTQSVTGPAQAMQTISEAATTPGVVAADISGVVTPFAEDTVVPMAADPLRPNQYHLTQLCVDPVANTVGGNTCNGRNAWEFATGASQIVAVIDSSMKTDHPDLAGKLVPGAVCLDSAPCVGRTVTPAADAADHATHVAGIIGEVADNGIGGSGFASNVQIMPIAALRTTGTTGDMANAVAWAVANGADVINISAGTDTDSSVLRAAIADAVAAGAVIVAAAGNSGATSPVFYPAAYPGVAGVGAVDSSSTIWYGSSRGSWVDVVAPGVTILSTCVTVGEYCYMTGTSMAAPMVSGMVALIRQQHPEYTATQIFNTVENTAVGLGAPGRDDVYGHGLISPVAALAAGAPLGPTGLVATGDYGSARVSFTPGDTKGTTIANYSFSTNGGSTWQTLSPADATSPVTIPGLVNGVTTPVMLRPITNTGAVGLPSAAVNATAKGAVFVPVPPQRAYDSRTSGGPISAGQTRTIDTRVSGYPAGTVAVAYNLTVADTVGAGYLTVVPGNTTTLPTSSTINWDGPGMMLANGYTVGVDPSGRVKVFNGVGSTQFILDIVGFYVPESMTANGAVFVPVSPVRAYDSRDPGAGGPLNPGAQRVVSVAAGGAVPTSATAIAYNLTVADTVNAGHLAVVPGNSTESPTSSTINWSASNRIFANSTVVGVSDRSVRVLAGPNPTNFIIDINGYYLPVAQAPAGATRFTPITPKRAYDSREPGAGGPIACTQSRTTSVAIGGDVPVGSKAVAFNLTLDQTVNAGYLTVTPGGTTLLPLASTINWYRNNQVIANGAAVNISADRTVTTFAGCGSTQYIIDVAGYFN